jgi:hypothetical protein
MERVLFWPCFSADLSVRPFTVALKSNAIGVSSLKLYNHIQQQWFSLRNTHYSQRRTYRCSWVGFAWLARVWEQLARQKFHFLPAQKGPQQVVKIVPRSLCSTTKRNHRILNIVLESVWALEFNGTDWSHLPALMIERSQCCWRRSETKIWNSLSVQPTWIGANQLAH